MVADGHCTTKQFTAEEFGKVLRSTYFIGACAFWRAIERLASPEWQTNSHAHGVLRELAMRVYEDCQGIALSPEEAECFRYCGLTPRGVRPSGALGKVDGSRIPSRQKVLPQDRSGRADLVDGDARQATPCPVSSCSLPIPLRGNRDGYTAGTRWTCV
jgi:hypothetical protein